MIDTILIGRREKIHEISAENLRKHLAGAIAQSALFGFEDESRTM